MATFQIVLLSSSPPGSSGGRRRFSTPSPAQQRVGMAPSAQRSPSPLEDTTAKTLGALRTGSRAAPVPDGARVGFATAGSLVKSRHFTLEHDDEFADIESAQSRRNSLQEADKPAEAPKKTRKRSTKSADTGDGAQPEPKKPRARTSNKAKLHNAASRTTASTTSAHFPETAAPTIGPINETAPFVAAKSKAAKPRKPRAKKKQSETNDNEPITKKAKVTKPKGAAKSGGKAGLKASTTVSEHFPRETLGGNGGDDKAAGRTRGRTEIPDSEDESLLELPLSPRRPSSPFKNMILPYPLQDALDLDEAVTRRRDWTPARDTTNNTAFVDSTAKENIPLFPGPVAFTSIVSGFAFADAQPPSKANHEVAPAQDPRATKKRRVDLIEIPANQPASRSASPEKGKAPKKKPRTITDIVTNQYALPTDASSDLQSVSSAFFKARTTTTTIPLNDTSKKLDAKVTKKPTRKRSSGKSSEKGESKSKKASAKSAAKPKPVAEKLLSPESAMTRLNQQDILFGTSSQLALEESPSLIREIQRAIRESEQDAEVLPGIQRSPSTMARSLGMHRLEKVEGRRQLWAASARDDDGGLLETQNDLYIPEPDRTQDFPLLMDGTVDNQTSLSSNIGEAREDHTTRNQWQFSDCTVMESSKEKDGRTFYGPTSSRRPSPSWTSESVNKLATVKATNSPILVSSDSPAPVEGFSVTLKEPSPPPSHQPTLLSTPKKQRGRPRKSPSAIAQFPEGLPNSCSESEPILDSENDEALSPTPPRLRYSVLSSSSSPSLTLRPSSSGRIAPFGRSLNRPSPSPTLMREPSDLQGQTASRGLPSKPLPLALPQSGPARPQPPVLDHEPVYKLPEIGKRKGSKKGKGTDKKAKEADKKGKAVPMKKPRVGPIHEGQSSVVGVDLPKYDPLHLEVFNEADLDYLANLRNNLFEQITKYYEHLVFFDIKDGSSVTYKEFLQPVVVEDLTKFLNDAGLRTWCRATKEDIKLFSDHRTLKGMEKPHWHNKTLPEGKVLAKPKKLQVFQVKEWAEKQGFTCVQQGDGKTRMGMGRGLY